ncbi:heavy metal-associated isoprenylated plant protein 31-like isoform X2 [Magnolia sinica]|uniref:heavy metal-associated isoprenylated plant protein 31-like isoform X2 n=1 Tax=Magnolia sinica TaxID=86752 RepID=UPI002658447C|nr:heavy metal-associated isoprenylated plant protein 31-like isoform X2 [Magnolia sinica]
MSVIQVRVPNLDCEGCATKIRKALFKLEDEIDIEMETQKFTVRGHAVEEKKVIKTVCRTGKAAEPWPFPAYSHYSSFYKYPAHIANHYYELSSNDLASVHTFFRTPATYSVAVASDEAVASLFSDENPHASTIM